ncbi:MAG: anti-sigma factor antagonist [Proteobacteria bacterium]|nr:anti-sigma factor antagonist [Pseudomonadota bacterium]
MDVFKVNQQSVEGGTTIVALDGEIDVHTAPRLREHLDTVLQGGSSRLVVDLENVRYIDSSGLSVLLETHRRAETAGGRMAIICTRSQILKLFSLTQLSEIFHVHASEGAAISDASSAR